MKKFLVLLIVLLTYSCKEVSHKDNTFVVNEYKTIVIEGCDYIIMTKTAVGGHVGFGMHKGNCSNPIHKCD